MLYYINCACVSCDGYSTMCMSITPIFNNVVMLTLTNEFCIKLNQTMTASLTIYNTVQMSIDFVLKPIQSLSYIFLMVTWRHLSSLFNWSSSPQLTSCLRFIASSRKNIKECDVIFVLCFGQNNILPLFLLVN